VAKDDIFVLANKNEIALLAKSLMENLFEGKCSLTEELQREDVNVFVEYYDIKLEKLIENLN
jgi:hypothetical protein